MRSLMFGTLCVLAASLSPAPLPAADDAAARREQYVDAVTRGEGYLPWQEQGLSQEEKDFRASIERRKTEMLQGRAPQRRPVLLDAGSRERALRNIENADWARSLASSMRASADRIVSQPAGYVDQMISELTPWYDYGMTCPNCVGKQSQEGIGHGLLDWDATDPDKLTCRECGHVYPSEQYPETARLVMPRSGQTLTFYLNEKERANPDNRTGELAYKWVNRPMHMSFTGLIRQNKALYLLGSLENLAVTWHLTGDPRYAVRTREILVRFAECYRNWLYHDYWNSVADADPLYAAWHDDNLKLEMKRHLTTNAFRGDTLGKAAMLQNFWGGGRLHPSTDHISLIYGVALAYDLTADARDAGGAPVWTDAQKEKVERDLFLEWIFTGEKYLGGPNEAKLTNNKAPRIYHAMASVAMALNLPQMADTALRGYEGVRDHSFKYDGYSIESPSYTLMYLSDLLPVPERLYNFEWPESFAARRQGTDIYKSDAQLRMIYRMMLDMLQPDGEIIPHEDSDIGQQPSQDLVEFGLARYPEYYAGKGATITGGATPTLYALFNLEADAVEAAGDLDLPEIYFPAWMTSILRHGEGKQATTLSFNFSPDGGHRHADNLAIFYNDSGDIMLGDHGYVGDTPVNGWIRSTQSHNLVVVDESDQRQGRREGASRQPRLELMFATPRLSVAEASSDAYAQCGEYRRLIALLKGPGAQTLALDIFRVEGGKKHSYRIFSELASSDAADKGALTFEGIQLPAEPPLPQFSASIEREAIFGLRDIRKVDAPAPVWQATWTQPGRSLRFWNLAPAGRVEASNGPGQEDHEHVGRRVRYLNVINEGEGVSSTFVGLYEPGGPDGLTAVRAARRIEVPAAAGPDAVAVAIDTAWGSYLVLNEFDAEAEVEGVKFQGKLGIFGRDAAGSPWLVASGAPTFEAAGTGFRGQPAEWSSAPSAIAAESIAASGRPDGWQDPPEGCRNWLLLNDGEFDTGFEVTSTDASGIKLSPRFPLPGSATGAFRLPALRVVEGDQRRAATR